jgi:arylsulfatase
VRDPLAGVIKPGTCPTRSSRTPTCCRRSLPRPASPTSSRSSRRAQGGNKTFKVHIDGYNLLPFLKGEVKENPRKGFLYWSDDGDLMALRVGNWKAQFLEQRARGVGVWQEPLVALRVPRSSTCAVIIRAGQRRRIDVL